MSASAVGREGANGRIRPNMSLSITSLKNHLPSSPASYLVRSSCTDLISYDELVDFMAKGRTTLTKPDIAGCVELFCEEIVRLVEDGKYVKTPLGGFFLCASGTLSKADDPFTPGAAGSDHGLRLHFRPERALSKEILAEARLGRSLLADRSAPFLLRARALRGDTEGRAKAGDFVRIEGKRLDFDASNESVGVFFLNGKESRSEFYVSVRPGAVIAEVPPGLEAGSYCLAVRSMPNGRDVKEGKFETAFLVEGK